LLLQGGKHVRSDGLLELGGRKIFIRPLVDPRLCRLTLTVLFEVFEELSEPAAQKPADPAARKPAT
jgi:hypothetical protein